MDTQFNHLPVLKHEAIEALAIKPNGSYLDATFGRGGHSQEILERLDGAGRLFAFDRDKVAVQYGKKKFAHELRLTLFHASFSDMAMTMASQYEDFKLDGILMDLGVSSPQLDDAHRGFSFMRQGELDMRMDTSKGETAAQWLSYVEEKTLVDVLFQYGEEKFARKIARAIVLARQEEPISTTLQLAEIVANHIPKKEKNKHPATRTFQAIRIYINQELSQIEQVLPQAVSLLKAQGRLAVISFHSLEDRIVKRFFRRHSTASLPPKHIPLLNDDAYETPLVLVGKAVKPSQVEIQTNPRSRSSVMRIAQRTEHPFSTSKVNEAVI